MTAQFISFLISLNFGPLELNVINEPRIRVRRYDRSKAYLALPQGFALPLLFLLAGGLPARYFSRYYEQEWGFASFASASHLSWVLAAWDIEVDPFETIPF